MNELYTTKPVALIAPKDDIADLKLKPMKLVQIDSKYYDASQDINTVQK